MKAIWDVTHNWEVWSDEGSMSYKMSFSNVKGRKYNGWDDWEGVYGTKRGLGSIIKMSQEEWVEEYRQAAANDIEEDKDARMFESIGELGPEELRSIIWEYEHTGRFSLEERRDADPWLYVEPYQDSEEEEEY